MRNLIFFCALFCAGCKKQPKEISIRWTDQQPTAIEIPSPLLSEKDVTVRLAGSRIAIAGTVGKEGSVYFFEPLIPFTPGLQYEIFTGIKKIGSISIPLPEGSVPPSILGIFPSGDTVPENLLKVYVRFSKPMQEFHASRNVLLLNSSGDTVTAAFLDLEPELWNNERTLLTRWLDPGRIKRNLAPNTTLGAPMTSGENYTVVIRADWRDVQGLPLNQEYRKTYRAVARDGKIIDPAGWSIQSPVVGTFQPLRISFHEALDYGLLSSVFHLLDERGVLIKITASVQNNEKALTFVPERAWTAGIYSLQIESRLEDLAGNNLSRPFDRDLLDGKTIGKDGRVAVIKIRIRD